MEFIVEILKGLLEVIFPSVGEYLTKPERSTIESAEVKLDRFADVDDQSLIDRFNKSFM